MTDPNVVFTRKLIEPPNSFRATSVLQMFDFKLDATHLIFTYDVGIPPAFQPFPLLIRNLSVSHDLQVDLRLPKWIVPDITPQFLLARGGEKRTVTLSFNEDAAREISKTTQRQIVQNMGIVVTPLQVAGPVYVTTVPTPLT
jgi:hypothetical protein